MSNIPSKQNIGGDFSAYVTGEHYVLEQGGVEKFRRTHADIAAIFLERDQLRRSPETPAEHDSGWYVEEWLGGNDWRRHALAHIWETKADARKQLDDLMHRNPNTTFRLAPKTGTAHEP